jgi:hypothetical protein
MKYPMVKSESDRTWLKYCGFLDLTISQFSSIQESLLLQQVEKMSGCKLGQKIMGKRVPRSVDEFRRFVPLTKYEDYLPELENKNEDCLPEKPFAWAHTSGGSIAFRKVPISAEANRRQLDHLMAAFILACSKSKGHSTVAEGDRVLFNVAPKPYLSGILASGAAETFNMQPIYTPDDHDNMEFREKMTRGFELSLRTGMDILVAMTSVLVKTGTDFDNRSKNSNLSKHLVHPGECYRMVRAFLRSKLEKRHVLPKDIWPLKALICWGIDTAAYKEQVYKYWGAYPYQFHACTEAGIMAVQTWNRKDMTFIPNSNFYEFISEEEWGKSREDVFYEPKTVLLSEVIPGERYELVITSFYGGPFIRYRLGHLIRITALEDEEAGILLPQMVFESRSDELIDIAGFTRICEKAISQAVSGSHIDCEDWVARKEIKDNKPVLHLYTELRRDYSQIDLASVLQAELMKADQGYNDLARMMEIFPLQVTLLKKGSFNNFMKSRHSAGFDLAQQRPVKMNTTDDEILELMGLPLRSPLKSVS